MPEHSDALARGAHFVQSLEPDLAAIRAFDSSAPERTLSAPARLTG